MTAHRRPLAGLIASVGLMAGAAGAEDAARVTGIDLSHYNKVASWSDIETARIAFVILKATDGLDYLDPTFAQRFRTLGDAGMIRGAYHFYETDDDPAAQADWFIRNVALAPGDLPPIVDIERVKAPVTTDLQAGFRTFLQRIEAHYGTRPIIYTGPAFWDHVMKEVLPDYPLWVAEYGTDAPTIPDGWQTWTLWQYTETRSVKGIDGHTDSSHFNGNLDALRKVLLAAPSN